jgi:polyisoprenoid-binding protein YceI
MGTASDLTTSAWRLDPAASTVEFHVPHFWGLVTVKGHFERFQGTLDLRGEPAVQLIVEAASLDTKNARRDKHLRSADFFDVEQHPQVRFVSDTAALDGNALTVHGHLHAAGKSVPLELNATVRDVDGHVEVEAVTQADQRQLGMTWSPLRMLRSPSKLIIRGRLVHDDPALRG